MDIFFVLLATLIQRYEGGQYSELQLLILVSTTLTMIKVANGNTSKVKAEWLGVFSLKFSFSKLQTIDLMLSLYFSISFSRI